MLSFSKLSNWLDLISDVFAEKLESTTQTFNSALSIPLTSHHCYGITVNCLSLQFEPCILENYKNTGRRWGWSLIYKLTAFLTTSRKARNRKQTSESLKGHIAEAEKQNLKIVIFSSPIPGLGNIPPAIKYSLLHEPSGSCWEPLFNAVENVLLSADWLWNTSMYMR